MLFSIFFFDKLFNYINIEEVDFITSSVKIIVKNSSPYLKAGKWFVHKLS